MILKTSNLAPPVRVYNMLIMMKVLLTQILRHAQLPEEENDDKHSRVRLHHRDVKTHSPGEPRPYACYYVTSTRA